MAQQVSEFHSIMPIVNIPSVLRRGILSHELASQLSHDDLSMPEVQYRRANVRVPGGLRLHQYANLYFHARNPMLYRRLEQVGNLCILRVSTEVLDIDGTVITDQNAASSYVRFLPPSAIDQLQLDQIYAESWTHPDEIAYRLHKSQKCAEVLVPQKIETKYIIGAYVVTAEVQKALRRTGFPQPIEINPYMFFRRTS